MTRRIIRTLVQFSAVALITFVVVFFLDRRYRVLPHAWHEFNPLHHPGLVITDVVIKRCSNVNLFSSCKLDPETWHRIDKDLFLGTAWFASAYLFVARKREEELVKGDTVVVDVQVGRLDPSSGDRANQEENWEPRDLGLWIKRSSKVGAGDSKRAVNAVDVLFGDDAVEVREGWQMVSGTALLLNAGPEIPGAHVTVLRGDPKERPKPQPRINDNGKFKIVQLADLHLSTGVGHCREATPDSYHGGRCEADPRTLDFAAKILDEEKPDLVVLSGDQVNGDTAPDAQSAIFKYVHLLNERKIPYVEIFGNHDDEGSLPRAQQMALIETLPYSLSKAGPEDIDGVGNYYIEVLSRGSSSHSALTIYLLDSHSYSPDERHFPGYDWIHPNQIDWFRQTAASLKRKHKEYTHVHMDVAFIHIPLPEYVVVEQYRKGDWREPATCPAHNSGFRDALVEQGVVMVSCGHDHVNEYCALSTEPVADADAVVGEDGEAHQPHRPALWMCYGGAAGFGGYAGYGIYHRKIRVFDFDMNEARISTWKRVEFGDDVPNRIDEQIIVDGGRPVEPME